MSYPDIAAFEPETRMQAIEREAAKRERAVAIKKTVLDYRLALEAERAQRAAEFVEAIVGQPETAAEFSERPLEVVKLAAVADSGLDVRGVALLADYCAKRAAILEPGKYGPKAAVEPPSAGPSLEQLQAQVQALEAKTGLFARLGYQQTVTTTTVTTLMAETQQAASEAPALPDSVADDGGSWD